MRFGKESGVLLLITFVLTLSLVSAEIIVSQPNSLYNLGDRVNVSVTLIPSSDTTSFFSSKLICPDGEVEIYRSPETVKSGQQKTLIISTNLDKSLIGNIKGDCHIKASYGNEEISSQVFEISNKVFVTFDAGSGIFNPGESFKVSGMAKKANGNLLNGYVEVSIPGLNVSFLQQITSGVIGFNITIPMNTAPAVYDIVIKAYEKDSSGGVMNEGSSSQFIKIRQIMTSAAVALSDQAVSPGKSISYTPLLYDQAGGEISDDVSVTIYEPNENVYLKKLVRSGEAQSLVTVYNNTPGLWKIEMKRNDISAYINFQIDEFESASFNLETDTLVISNLGNVVYKRPVEIMIGDNKEVEEIKLNVNEVKRIRLYAPEGNYKIGVNDGTELKDLGTASISSTRGTGFAIGGADGIGISFKSAWWVWLIVILILGGVALFYFRKVRNKAYYGKVPNKEAVNVPSKAKSLEAHSSMIGSGEKKNSIVMAVKIKNNDSLKNAGSKVHENITKALQIAKNAQAKVYSDGNYRIIVFPPSMSSSKENIQKSLNVAQSVKDVLDDHNKKYVPKVEYGIGINLGELIVESSDGDFKYHSVGNTVVSAKRGAEASHQEILLSENLQRKVIGSVKTEPLKGIGFHKLIKVVNREDHTEFINKFMQRQDSQ